MRILNSERTHRPATDPRPFWPKAGLLALLVLALPPASASAQTKLASECEAGDQRACVLLARSPADTELRLAAVRKVTDQAVLTELAKTCQVRSIRLAAIRGLIDQDALTDLARHAGGAVERGAAIERLKDQDVLADIARKDPSKWVRRKAASCLTDPAQIEKLVSENRKELLPTITFGGGIGHVKLDGKVVKETLLGVTTVLPGHHEISAAFQVKEDVSWDADSENTTVLDAKLGAAYSLEAEVGIVTWEYLSPKTRRGRGTWKLVIREEVSSGPDLLPQLLKR
jgi:hypothetical protein